MRATLIALLALAGSLLVAVPASACSCLPRADSDWFLARPAGTSPVVFEATVSSIWEVFEHARHPIRIAFLRDVKGWIGRPPHVMLVGNGGAGACQFGPEVGRRYLIDGSRGLIGLVSTSVCSRTRPIELAAESVQQLKRLSNP